MNQTITMEEQDPSKQEVAERIKHLETLKDSEEKLRASISFMREALSQKGTPNFKGFWEVRKICLPLFKETLTPPVRAQLWGEYIELTREGRRLKNLLDQETAFAVEQIELAISSIEKTVTSFHENPEGMLKEIPPIAFPQECAALEGRLSRYQYLQKQLNLLNVHATRINSLRKELIRTEMRIRQKNQFFLRLSELGDRVFPVRKELIREVSESFVQDVDGFVETHFSEATFSLEKIRRNVFFFREEIKILQAIAKILTLNTHAFSTTREQLSQCWDKLKGMEKELKREFAQQKQKSNENAEQVVERIKSFAANWAANQYSLDEGFQELESISRWMREIELTRQDVFMLKEELAKVREPLEAKRTAAVEERRQTQVQLEQNRAKKIEEFRREIETLAERISTGEIEELLKQLEEHRRVCASLPVTKVEKQTLERKLKTIRDQLAEREEQTVLDLSADDRVALEGLNTILSQRKQRRKEIKAQIEEFRKVSGSSGLDFEKAMRMQELMREERERLAKLDEGIGEIENKIRSLKKKG